jgi:hypothetical protein
VVHPRLVTIRRLYQELQAVPSGLSATGKVRHQSMTARYQELVRLIRIESEAFKVECPEVSGVVLVSRAWDEDDV